MSKAFLENHSPDDAILDFNYFINLDKHKSLLEEDPIKLMVILTRYLGLKRYGVDGQLYWDKPLSPRKIKDLLIGINDIKFKIKTINISKYETAIKIYNSFMNELKHNDLLKYSKEDGQILWAINKGFNDINLGSLWTIIPKEVKDAMPEWKKINLPIQVAIEIRELMLDISEVDVDKYNKADGLITWATDKGFNSINLSSLWTITPKEVKNIMTEWKLIDLPIQVAIKIRKLLLSMSQADVEKYGKEDGQIQWAIDKDFSDINLGHLWTIIPKEVKDVMTEWKLIDLPIQVAIEIRELMLDISEVDLDKYNKEDGLITWATDKGFNSINLGHLWTIIPKEVKDVMTEWKKINLPIQVAIKIRELMLSMSQADVEKYGKEDGQIQWAIDRGFNNINLSSLWTIIPKEIKDAMPEWELIDLPIQVAIKIRKLILSMSQADVEKCSKEDGQIFWAIDKGFNDINLGNLWTIIPKEVKDAMPEWKLIDLPIQVAIKIRKLMLDMSEADIKKYNKEDGQIQWAIDRGFNSINLGHLWTIIPKEVKDAMTEWKLISLPIQVAIEIRELMLNISEVNVEKYSKEDGQILWAIDRGFNNINLSSLWTITPKKTKDIMPEWKLISLPIQVAIKIRKLMLSMSQADIKKYGNEDGQIFWAIDKGFDDIHLGSLWTIIPKDVKNIMSEWKSINLPIQVAIKIRKLMLNMSENDVEKYGTEDGQVQWAIDKGFNNINLGNLWTIIPKEVKNIMTEWKLIDLPIQVAIKKYNFEG